MMARARWSNLLAATGLRIGATQLDQLTASASGQKMMLGGDAVWPSGEAYDPNDGSALVAFFRAMASQYDGGHVLIGDPATWVPNWASFDQKEVEFTHNAQSPGPTVGADPSPLAAAPSMISGGTADRGGTVEGGRVAVKGNAAGGYDSVVLTALVKPRAYAPIPGVSTRFPARIFTWSQHSGVTVGLESDATDSFVILGSDSRKAITGIDPTKWHVIIMSGQKGQSGARIDYREVGSTTWLSDTFTWNSERNWGRYSYLCVGASGSSSQHRAGTWNVALVAGWDNKDDHDLVKDAWDAWGV